MYILNLLFLITPRLLRVCVCFNPLSLDIPCDIGTQPPSGGCVLKQYKTRICVLTSNQPPSGGCVLKLPALPVPQINKTQPPSGGCVLKHFIPVRILVVLIQPPSGGCVLKQKGTTDF